MRVADWLARTLFLILAGSATLALIGSLASVSDSALSDAFPGRVTVKAPSDVGIQPELTAPDAALTNAIGRPETDDARNGVAAMPTSAEAPARVRWMKALTYAVLALAGFAAAALVALIRIATHLGTLAKRVK